MGPDKTGGNGVVIEMREGEHDVFLYDTMDKRSIMGSIGLGPDGVFWLLRSAQLGGGIAFGVSVEDVIEQSLVLERVQNLRTMHGPLWWLK